MICAIGSVGSSVIGHTFDNEEVTAAQVNAQGSMTALLRDALAPNLVQTLENNPAFIHGGPFGNIAHGCSSIIATQLGLGIADYTVTEAGFGSDLGAEKFFNIKCRSAGLRPDAAVLVATIRALKSQGGAKLKELGNEDVGAVENGLDHLQKHVENLQNFGMPVVVCLNSFVTDTEAEQAVVFGAAERLGVRVVGSRHWEHGGAGAEDLAHAVVDAVESGEADFKPLYPDDARLLTKVKTIAREVYGADDIIAPTKLRKRFHQLEAEGYGNLPICMAKTQYSLSTDPALKGRPENFDIPLRDVELRAGAGFILVLTGSIMTMPGLPKKPAAEEIDLNEKGEIVGLF